MSNKPKSLEELDKLSIEKTPVEILQNFLNKEGLVISAVPQFIPTNHGSFEISIVVSVQKRNT